MNELMIICLSLNNRTNVKNEVDLSSDGTFEENKTRDGLMVV